MKHLIALLFLSCLIISYCSAQSTEELIGPRAGTGARSGESNRTVNTIAVTFIADDTCNLTIDYRDYGKFVKNTIVRLPLGNHRLFFESLETGKTIRDRSFRLTRDRLTGGTYNYPVSFK